MAENESYTSFAGVKVIGTGDLRTMLLATKVYLDRGGTEPVLIFEDRTGKQIDFDFRGTPDEMLGRLASHPHLAPPGTAGEVKAGPGRPKLGVVCREVSLLPRHWEWLARQKGGASAALRRLIDEKRKEGDGDDSVREAREAAGRFMWAIAGNLPAFEEASRALYAGDDARLKRLIGGWPHDIRLHIERLIAGAAGSR